jgi:hypothetical protein
LKLKRTALIRNLLVLVIALLVQSPVAAQQGGEVSAVSVPPKLSTSDTVPGSGREFLFGPRSAELAIGVDSPRRFSIENSARPLLSERGRLVGGAIGCVVGGILGYRTPNAEGFDQRLAWGAGGCLVFAVPGAFFGGIWLH